VVGPALAHENQAYLQGPSLAKMKKTPCRASLTLTPYGLSSFGTAELPLLCSSGLSCQSSLGIDGGQHTPTRRRFLVGAEWYPSRDGAGVAPTPAQSSVTAQSFFADQLGSNEFLPLYALIYNLPTTHRSEG